MANRFVEKLRGFVDLTAAEVVALEKATARPEAIGPRLQGGITRRSAHRAVNFETQKSGETAIGVHMPLSDSLYAERSFAL